MVDDFIERMGLDKLPPSMGPRLGPLYAAADPMAAAEEWVKLESRLIMSGRLARLMQDPASRPTTSSSSPALRQAPQVATVSVDEEYETWDETHAGAALSGQGARDGGRARGDGGLGPRAMAGCYYCGERSHRVGTLDSIGCTRLAQALNNNSVGPWHELEFGSMWMRRREAVQSLVLQSLKGQRVSVASTQSAATQRDVVQGVGSKAIPNV